MRSTIANAAIMAAHDPENFGLEALEATQLLNVKSTRACVARS
jgi:hypothetical protein